MLSCFWWTRAFCHHLSNLIFHLYLTLQRSQLLILILVLLLWFLLLLNFKHSHYVIDRHHTLLFLWFPFISNILPARSKWRRWPKNLTMLCCFFADHRSNWIRRRLTHRLSLSCIHNRCNIIFFFSRKKVELLKYMHMEKKTL